MKEEIKDILIRMIEKVNNDEMYMIEDDLLEGVIQDISEVIENYSEL
jgi:hypothetical protein